jgi:hypothetical protein
VSSPVGGVADDEPSGDEADLLAANAAFYRAFEAADLDAMSDLWEHSDRVECVHPGWSALRGWGEVAASWATLFGGRQRLQFILTDARAEAGERGREPARRGRDGGFGHHGHGGGDQRVRATRRAVAHGRPPRRSRGGSRRLSVASDDTGRDREWFRPTARRVR